MAALKQTNVTLQLLTDIDMYLMIENGIRGGISTAFKRYEKANHVYMNDYDPSAKSKFITYLDANNLYGFALNQELPVNGFEWVADKNFPLITTEIMNKQIRPGVGYILEVDLDYPQTIHDEHNDYPLAPDRMIVDTKQLSPYQIELMAKPSEKRVETCTKSKTCAELSEKRKICYSS